VHALGYSLGAATVLSLQRLARRRTKIAAAPKSLDGLDPASRTVLKTVSTAESFMLGEIPGLSRPDAQDALDRLNAMGILKCEFTLSRVYPEGRTVWTVYASFKDDVSRL